MSDLQIPSPIWQFKVQRHLKLEKKRTNPRCWPDNSRCPRSQSDWKLVWASGTNPMHGGPTPQHTAPKGSAANIPRSCVHALINQRWHKEELAECAARGCCDVADRCTSHERRMWGRLQLLTERQLLAVETTAACTQYNQTLHYHSVQFEPWCLVVFWHENLFSSLSRSLETESCLLWMTARGYKSG